MHLLILFLLGMVVVGVVTDRLDVRTWLLVAGGAVLTTMLYLSVARLMT